MAVTRKQVQRAGVTPAFPIGDGDITFHYSRPSPVYFDEMSKTLKSVKAEDQTLSNTLAAQLIPLITEWDYNDDDGKPLPINEANLLTLPTGILKQCAEYIMEAENLADSKNAPTPSATSS
jgi:hypothetical protein